MAYECHRKHLLLGMLVSVTFFSGRVAAAQSELVQYSLGETSKLFWQFSELERPSIGGPSDAWGLLPVVPGEGVHNGDDFYADDWTHSSGGNNDAGKPVRAVGPGKVIHVTSGRGNGDRTCSKPDYGNQVIIRLMDKFGGLKNYAVRYAHLQDVSVVAGQTVDFTEVLGTVGYSGLCGHGLSSAHLHLALYKNILDLADKVIDGQSVERPAIEWLREGRSPSCLTTCEDPGPTSFAAKFEVIATKIGLYEDPSADALHWLPGPSTAFLEAYGRNGAYEKLGIPTNYVHCWSDYVTNLMCNDGVRIQDLFRSKLPRFGAGDTALILRPEQTGVNEDEVRLVKEGFWCYYKKNHGYRNLGPPLEEERAVPGGTEQRFVEGTLRWPGGDDECGVEFIRGGNTVGSAVVGLRAGVTHQIWNSGSLVGSTPLDFEGCSGCKYTVVASPSSGSQAIGNLKTEPPDCDKRVTFTTVSGAPLVDIDAIPLPPDPYSWEEKIGGAMRPESIEYGDGTYVVVGENGTLVTSDDGEQWVEQNFPGFNNPSVDFYDVAYGQGRWTVVLREGSCSFIAYSMDPTSGWTKLPSCYTNPLRTVHYGGGKWAALGDGLRLHSDDGNTWSAGTLSCPSGCRFEFADLTFDRGSGSWIAVSDSSRLGSLVAVSSDGVSWRQVDFSVPGARLRGIATDGSGRIVATGFKTSPLRPFLITSQDGGEAWDEVSLGGNESLFDVVFSPQGWVAVGRNVATSSDGVHWTIAPNNQGLILQGVGYSQDGPALFAIDSASIYKAIPGCSSPQRNVEVQILGEGTVSFSGQVCETDCSASFPDRAIIDFVAAPSEGWIFDRWEGSCSGDGECRVILSEDRVVVARFLPAQQPLTLQVEGEGSIVVSPGNSSCSNLCSFQIDTNSHVDLAPNGESGWLFSHWEGDCAGGQSCGLFMGGARSATAVFTPCEYILETTQVTIPTGGVDGVVGLTTNSACSWTASSSVNWVEITSESSGIGSSSVSYSVSINDTGEPRIGLITVQGVTLTIRQEGNGTDPDCRPPAAGTWTVSTSCTFVGEMAAVGDVVVPPGVVLTVGPQAVLEIDLANRRLLVQDGGGVLIKTGGAVRSVTSP